MALWNLKVYGIVQGVGFRPFVSRLADRMGIFGTVANKGPYVEIFAQGDESALGAFREEILHRPPIRAAVLKLDTEVSDADENFTCFDIIESEKEQGKIFVSPDIATCEECKRELFDPQDRRYLHPFINCTACGPRLTILDAMPYDRERTSMGEFPMCPACEREYTHAETRRYDAQPVCCNDCGPEVYLIDGNERGSAAITRTREILAQGGIVAIKGIGGFHLTCDATNEETVRRLRTLKHRPCKPFAVMAKDLQTAMRECVIAEWQKEILEGHQKPILLLSKKTGGRIAEAAAPGNPRIGLMLPYAPIQMLLFDYPDGIRMPDLLIMTSGNPSGAPICRTDEDAKTALAPLCEAILSHNRNIRLRADDSVMDSFRNSPYMIRRSRGYAPLPVFFGKNLKGQVLGIGGELKNSFALARDDLFYLSPYIGDMSDLRTVQALKESVERMEHLLEIRPSVVACDPHPRYHASEVAKALGLPVLEVQHHYAHILSCMAENGCTDPVIGVSFDGTGYGTDGTIWGGEFLLADLKGFRRLGSIEPFLQAGGEKASKEGWRIAVSLLYGLLPDRNQLAELVEKLHLANEQELSAQLFMLEQQVNCITSTSAGRLFDAVSALLGIRKSSTFEGEASMYLQFAAERYAGHGLPSAAPAAPSVLANGCFHLPTGELFHSLLRKRLSHLPTEQLAYEFHEELALQILQGCQKSSELTGLRTIALSGGVFQNTLLLRLTCDLLKASGFRCLHHHLIPANDGGIALGQAVAAMYAVQS